MTDDPATPSPLPLPAGFHLVRDRSRPDAVERLVEAERDGLRVALRLSPDSGAAEGRAELALLASVTHPGLAKLVDFGALPAGGRFVAREWIDGRDLASWAVGREPEAIGRVVAQVCAALAALHARGFVHGDLKASNVLVVETGPSPRAVLTDFGLARTHGARGEASGTLFHIAPELLLGGTFEASADLFALGVMLHELLLGRRSSARDFYGRFPAFDFFEATGTRAEELPEWSRDVVAALVEREPHRRPRAAAVVGRTLAGRLGAAGDERDERVELHWPPLRGREEWTAQCLRSLAPDGEPRFRWLVFAAEEDPRATLDAVALRAALAGLLAQRHDASRELDRAGDLADLERWARGLCARFAGATVFLALERASTWAVRAVAMLAQIVREAPADERPAGVVVGAHVTAPDTDVSWVLFDVPEVSEAAVGEFVREQLEEDEARAALFAERLAAAGRGSAARLERSLHRAVQQGWIVAGEHALRLRPGPLPASLAEAEAALAVSADSAAARLLAAALVIGGAARLADAAELAAIEAGGVPPALEELVAGELIAIDHTADGTSLRVLVAAPRPASALVGETTWRQMHAARAERLAALAAPRARTLPHAIRAARADAAQVVDECESLREHGNPTLALELCEAVIAQRHAAELEVEPELIGERALAWCAMGDTDRALESIAPWQDESALTPRARAIAERVRGQVATAKHELTAALEHLERARELDPEDGGAAVLAKLRLLAELDRDGEVLASIAALRGDAAANERLLPRVAVNLRILEALSAFRSGDVERARQVLETEVEQARRVGDAGREAGVRLNLATVERRSGELQRALAHFERAAQLYEEAGLLPGLAQARAQFGSTLREVGELARAQPLLASALELRERLGDRVGATSVRGMLGLLFADRGHARAATEELERAASDLRGSGRSRVAVMLEARAIEMRARFGDRSKLDARASSEADRTAEGDPRILLSRGRALWLGGDAVAAEEHVQRADALAGRLGLGAWRQEAQYLLARLHCDDPRPPSSAETLVDADELVLALLSRVPLELERVRSLAGELAARGRDDRAARLLLAIAARVEPERARAEAGHAEALIAACTRGLSAAEARTFQRALLSIPDPWPEDFVAHERRLALPEEDEMEVIKLLDINHRLLAQEDLRSLLGLIVDQALSASGAQRGFLILEEDGELKVDTALDSRRGGIDTPDVEVSGSVLREALQRMQPIRVSNAVDDPLLGAAPSVISLELRSIVCIPFQVQQGLRGVIYVDHRLREGAFDTRVERMLSLLADQAALAILQVRRLEEIRRLNRELGRQVARKDSDLKTATAALRKLNLPAPAGGLVGDAPAMREVRRVIERAAQSKLSVLVGGPSGSGKELAARALHELGPRQNQPFVSENCAALPASLIEAELFGARRGAYTGADRDREGLFVRAHGGTLFLDEIGELPLELQSKLLRVLETSQVRRLGDDRVRTVDFRLVAATNRDLAREVAAGRFRADLYYRLDGLRVTMPALAEHPEDVPALIDHYLRLQAEPGHAQRAIAPAVVARLCRRAWPGNVRELYNELARLLVMSEGDVTDPELVREPETGATALPGGSTGPIRTIDELEREAILQALRVAGNDKRKAAELLGISRAKVYQRLKEWGLTGPAPAGGM